VVSPEVVKKALEQIQKRAANHEYFFAKLASPDWIRPLEAAGLFASPPPAIRGGDTISFPFWPESRYLARMAALAPELVLEVVEKIPVTDNVRVHEEFAQAASRMPGPLAARWAKREARWIEQQEHLYFLLPEYLGELIGHLAATGEAEAALTLARALLRIRRGSEGKASRARLDSWNYGQILEKYASALLTAAGKPALDMLCGILGDALADEINERK